MKRLKADAVKNLGGVSDYPLTDPELHDVDLAFPEDGVWLDLKRTAYVLSDGRLSVHSTKIKKMMELALNDPDKIVCIVNSAGQVIQYDPETLKWIIIRAANGTWLR